jgi:hypothetical protein
MLEIVILVARHDARYGSSRSASQSAAAATDPSRAPNTLNLRIANRRRGLRRAVHSIAFRASSLKQAQELARFAAPNGGASSPARHPERSAPRNLSDTMYQVRLPL